MKRAATSARVAGALRACALCACAAVSQAGESRIAWAEVELRGPLRELVLAHGPADAERVRFEGELSDGESRTFAVPVPVRETTRARPPQFTWDVGADDAARGRARFVRWLPDRSVTIAPALRARPRPPVELHAPVVPAAALLALAAGALCVAALRRRVFAALATALASGGLAALLVEAGAGDMPARARVLEGATDQPVWLAVDSGSARLELAEETLAQAFEVAVDPPEAALEVGFALRAGAPVRLSAARARIHVLSAAAQPAAWSVDHNALGAFARTWLRKEGAWTAHGAWGSGAPFPVALAGDAAVHDAAPGWLTAGLPQGVDVFLGEYAARAGALAPPDAARAGRQYLRLALAP